MPFSDGQKQKILQRMQTGTPRFLFRTWHDESGGPVKSNTTTGIIPLRFKQDPSIVGKTFFDIDLEDLIETATNHLEGAKAPFATVYSSWTHSLPQAFGWISFGFTQRYRNLRVCILDTRRLPSDQVVLHTSAMSQVVSERIDGCYGPELLAYGPLGEKAYKAVSFDDIDKADLDKFFPNVEQGGFSPKYGTDYTSAGDVTSLFAAARNIGSLFGEYSIPVRAHLLACATQTEENHAQVLDALQSSTIPQDWLEDPDPMDLDVAGHTEAQRAAMILLDLARRAHGQGALESTAEQRRAVQDSQTFKRLEDAKAPPDALEHKTSFGEEREHY